MLSCDVDVLRRARQLLSREYGPVDLESAIWPFTDTAYYEKEMGSALLRQFIAFERPISSERLVEAKIESNAIERRIAADCDAIEIARPVNIDPGYVDPARLVLATTKDRAHRIHIGRGIHAEVTLLYVKGVWRELPWTYPDYRRAEYQDFMTRARARLMEQNPGAYEERAGPGDASAAELRPGGEHL